MRVPAQPEALLSGSYESPVSPQREERARQEERGAATLRRVEETSIPEPDGRAVLVRTAAQRWRGQLIDVGGRNTLLYYRDLKVGTLDLGTGAPVPLTALLDGRTVPLAQLYPDRDAHAQAVKRARAIRNKARELREERGIETCFLAIGMATWTRPQAGTASAIPAAPVLLRSATIRARGAAEEDFDLTLTGDVEVNPTLLHVLATDFDVVLDAEELAELEPALLFERLAKEAADRVHGFSITHRQVLGTFSYAKLPMVTDLVAGAETLLGHEVVAAIAGDRAAQGRLRERSLTDDVDPTAPDRVSPADEFIVLDADSSQKYAINAILAGQHCRREGPAGHRQEPDHRQPDRQPDRARQAGAVRRREAGGDLRGHRPAGPRRARPPGHGRARRHVDPPPDRPRAEVRARPGVPDRPARSDRSARAAGRPAGPARRIRRGAARRSASRGA